MARALGPLLIAVAHEAGLPAGYEKPVPLDVRPFPACGPLLGQHLSKVTGSAERRLRHSIVQCLCAYPQPVGLLLSLLITLHYGKVKQINQKALS